MRVRARVPGQPTRPVTVALAVVTVLVLLALGVAASYACLAPGRLSLPTRLASVPALGYAAGTGVGIVLAAAHVFTAAALIAGLLVAGGALGAVAIRRARRPREPGAPLTRAELIAAGVGLAAVAAIALARLAVPLNATAGGWRYWADGLELADLGHVPSHSLQWGGMQPAAVSKLAGNVFLGGLSFPFANHAFMGMAVALWLSTAAYALGLFALGWELGLRRTAPLLPILGVAGDHLPFGIRMGVEGIDKLTFFQDEDMGRALAVIGVALAIATLRTRLGWPGVAASAAVLAAGALTHAIPVAALVALLVAYGVIAVVVRRREWRRIAAVTAATVAGTVAIAVVALAAVGANPGFQGATGGQKYALFRGRIDPTAAMDHLMIPPHPKREQRFYEPASTTLRAFLRQAVELDAGEARVALALLLLLAVALALGRAGTRTPATAAAGMGALLLLAGLVFSFRSELYIPATFGDRRLFEYAVIPTILIVCAALEAVLDRLPLPSVAWGASAAALALVGVAAVGPHALRGDLRTTYNPTAVYVSAARVATPCNARLLATVNSKGAFQSLTGRTEILEGLGPFLRPAILRQVLWTIRRARLFVLHPDQHLGFLADMHVDYVLIGKNVGYGWKPFDRVPQLQRVGQVGNVRVYRVRGGGAGGVRPSDAPGYTCRRGPLR